MKNLDSEELEKRMRPDAWSRQGFLGQTESLQTVLETDAQTLAELGVTHTTIADSLEAILLNVIDQEVADRTKWLARMTPFPDLYEPRVNPQFSLHNLPDINIGYLVGKLQLFIQQWRGFQKCPWDCAVNTRLASIEFLILNRETGESFTGPGLIVHLIREHHFFEGKESPYRVDPEKAVRVLELL